MAVPAEAALNVRIGENKKPQWILALRLVTARPSPPEGTPVEDARLSGKHPHSRGSEKEHRYQSWPSIQSTSQPTHLVPRLLGGRGPLILATPTYARSQTLVHTRFS